MGPTRPLLPLQVRLMEEKGYVLGNLDCTIIAQKPKLSPHKVCCLQQLGCNKQ
jgi:2C-methyl-D-erythritol 2,4-cyclodiphosphate synthase